MSGVLTAHQSQLGAHGATRSCLAPGYSKEQSPTCCAHTHELTQEGFRVMWACSRLGFSLQVRPLARHQSSLGLSLLTCKMGHLACCKKQSNHIRCLKQGWRGTGTPCTLPGVVPTTARASGYVHQASESVICTAPGNLQHRSGSRAPESPHF